MSHQLVVQVTQKDDRLKEFIAFIASAGTGFKWRKLWENTDLSEYAGGGVNPLVLFGHANLANFIDEYGGGVAFSTYLSGGAVVGKLKQLNLRPTEFPFCVIAGCSSAQAKGKVGLFVNIADGLGIPTVGSTTEMLLSQKSDHLLMTPQSGGTWRVYFPSDGGEVHGLASGRCSDIKATLEKYVFRPST